MAASTVRVQGLRELDRAFGKLAVEVRTELRGALRAAAEPVRADAETRAVNQIENLGGQWSRMRTGVTTMGAYVAPRARNRGGSPRPNLAPLLMNEAMVPALDAHTAEVITAVDLMLDRLAGINGF